MTIQKVKLAPYKKPENSSAGIAAIFSALPFLLNERAILIHRPRKAAVYNSQGYPHLVVSNYCGNSFASRDKLTFIERPPKGRLVCEACEKRAIMAGQKASSEIVGEHVCIGKLKAINICCGGTANE